MKDKLHICILGSTYARDENDPQVPWLRETVSQLRKKGHKLTVVAPAFAGNSSHEIDEVPVLRYRYAPACIEKLTHDEGAPSKVKNPAYKILAFFYVLSGIVHLLFWSAKYKFDVINVHWPFPHGLFVILPKILFGTKIVVTAHGAGLAMARKSKLINTLLKFSLLAADEVTTNSSHTCAELFRLTGYESHIISYGATVSFKQAATPLDSKTTKILFSGRHIQRKGVDYLIKAVSILLQKKDVELYITGLGDRTEEWKTLALQLGIAEKVNFLGFVSNEKLAECYQSCDIYCLPAIFDDNDDTEGLGVVLIEALLHARPVVASRVGGIVDVIQHRETGLLVQEKDELELARALLSLIENPEIARELGKQGQRYVSEEFNWMHVSSLMEEVVLKASAREPKSLRALLASFIG